MEDLRKRFTNTEIELSILRKEKTAWTTFSDSQGVTPEQLSRDLLTERSARKAETDARRAAESEVAGLRARLKRAEDNADLLEGTAQDEKERKAKLERKCERIERQRMLALREVGFLKEQLRAFESEETVFLGGGAAGAVDAKMRGKIDALEKLVEEYKAELARVNWEGGSAVTLVSENGKRKREVSTGDDEESRRKLRILQNGPLPPQKKKELFALEAETDGSDLTQSRQSEQFLQKEVTSLKSQLESLEKAVKLSSTRILELKDNPTSRYQAVQKAHLDQLTAENTALLQRLQGKGSSVPKETIDRMRGDLQRMEDLVAQKEKRMMRLKEVSPSPQQPPNPSRFCCLFFQTVTDFFGRYGQRNPKNSVKPYSPCWATASTFCKTAAYAVRACSPLPPTKLSFSMGRKERCNL